MSNSNKLSNANPQSDLTADAVVAYLRSHPKFLHQHPVAWENQELTHDVGDATSLLQLQMRQLRKRCTAYSLNQEEMLKTAQKNDIQFEKTKLLVAELAGSTTLSEVMHALEFSFIEQFEAKRVKMTMFHGIEGNHHNIVSVGIGDASHGDWLALAKNPWADFCTVEGTLLEGLFDDGEERMQSAAVVPIHVNEVPTGVVVIASPDLHHYNKELDTLFLNHVAAVLGRVLGRLRE